MRSPIRTPARLAATTVVLAAVMVGSIRPVAGQDEVAPLGSIGDLVWFDDNDNGRLDDGEGGVPGVLVELRSADSGEIRQVATTGPDGRYHFSSVEVGTYLVALPASNWSSGPLRACVTSRPTTSDPGDFVDSDDNGVLAGDAVVAGPVVMSGTEDRTIDLGCHRPDLGVDLSVELDDAAEPAPGHVVPIRVAVANHGAEPIEQVSLAASVGPSIEVADKNWTGAGSGGVVTTLPSTLHPGETYETELRVRLDETGRGELTVRVERAETRLEIPGGQRLGVSHLPAVEIRLGAEDGPSAPQPVSSVEAATATRTLPDGAPESAVPRLALTGLEPESAIVSAAGLLVLGSVLRLLARQLDAATSRRRSSP